MINMIVAMSKNGVIGNNNDLPWGLKGDLKYFKEVTTGNTIVMGRKTYESIGKPLPNRKNIVLTRNDINIEGVEIFNSVIEVLRYSYEYPNESVFVIGGAEIYDQFLPYADKIYITEIEEEIDGDTYFPNKFKESFNLVKTSDLITELNIKSKDELSYRFNVYEKDVKN